MNKGRKIIGITLIILSLVAIFGWEKWGRQMLMYEEILVFNQDIEKNTILTSELLKIELVERKVKGSLTGNDVSGLLGKETVQSIHKGVPLFEDYFESPEMVVNQANGGYIMSIPATWLKSYPQTLRRGDRAYFYYKGKLITSAIVAYAKDGANQEVTSVDKKRLSGSSIISLVEIVVNNEQANLLTRIAESGNEFVILYN